MDYSSSGLLATASSAPIDGAMRGSCVGISYNAHKPAMMEVSVPEVIKPDLQKCAPIDMHDGWL